MKQLTKVLLILATWLSACSLFAQVEVKVSIYDGIQDAVVREKIEKTSSNLLSAFNVSIVEGKKLRSKLKEYMFTKEQEALLIKMWNSSAMLCPVSEIRERAIQMSDGGYQLRNIPISMLADEDDEKELVFEFTATGELDNVLVALDKHNYNQVICSNITVEDFTRRQIILDFVENFRTAYNRKDLEYLKMVYSDDALIITGKAVKRKQEVDGSAFIRGSLGTEKFVYQVQSKQEYIAKLERIFSKKNNYINLKFEDITVRRHPKYPHIYGVTLKQYWNTTLYSDIGYLFLMINFANENQPSIEVRTWQPEKVENTVISRDEVFSLDDFNI